MVKAMATVMVMEMEMEMEVAMTMAMAMVMTMEMEMEMAMAMEMEMTMMTTLSVVMLSLPKSHKSYPGMKIRVFGFGRTALCGFGKRGPGCGFVATIITSRMSVPVSAKLMEE